MPTNRSTTNKQANARTSHIARDAITSLQIELGNWYWVRSTTGPETAGGGNQTVSASIEYPEGEFTQVLWSEAATRVIASGSQALSDAVAVSIPKGARFWIRTFVNAVTAIVFSEGNTGFKQIDTANGEAYNYAASGLSDLTMGGTITDLGAVSGPIFVPQAIVAQTRLPSFLLIGDSRLWGFTDNYNNGSVGLGEVARNIGQAFGFINMGSAGDVYSAFNLNSAHRVGLKQYVSHVVIAGGINSLRSGGSGQNKSAATVLGELQTTIGLFTGVEKVITCTVAPNTSGAWTLVNGSDQTLNANQAAIQTYNEAIRAGVANSDGFFELAAPLSHASVSQKWLATGAVAGITGDGLHAVQAGYNLLAATDSSFPEAALVRPANPPAPAVGFQDNFNRADESLEASSDWTLTSGTAGSLTIVSSKLSCQITSPDSCYLCPDVTSDSMYVQMNWDHTAGTPSFFMGGRIQDANNFIGCRYNGSTNKVQLYTRIAGTFANLGNSSGTITAGDVVRMEINTTADTVRALVNGSEVIAPVALSGLFAGTTRAGLIGRTTFTTDWGDNFEAGEL
jgi:hypothetical protein